MTAGRAATSHPPTAGVFADDIRFARTSEQRGGELMEREIRGRAEAPSGAIASPRHEARAEPTDQGVPLARPCQTSCLPGLPQTTWHERSARELGAPHGVRRENTHC